MPPEPDGLLARAFPARPGPASVGAWLTGPVLDACNELISREGGRMLNDVQVCWDLRGRMAGQARQVAPGQGLVRLNRQLFSLERSRDELIDTGLHEMAHLCVFACWPGSRPHGNRWRMVASALGAKPRASHALPIVASRVSQEYAYQIGERTIWLGAVRHRRLQSGAAVYRIRTEHGAQVIEAAAWTGESRRQRAGEERPR